MSNWLLLITNLPGSNQALRMRLWRGLKAIGAASLRDGVYLLPDSKGERRAFEARSAEIIKAGGSCWLLPCTSASPEQEGLFRGQFDRATEYGELLKRLSTLRRRLPKSTEGAARRDCDRLQQELTQVKETDFFPGAAGRQADAAMQDAREALSARFSVGEPHATSRKLPRLRVGDYVGRVWATREHLWIDRVCSAWLIRRFIDPKAEFVWLKNARKLPKGAVGFDFDGARFTHVGAKVTFEVLIHSFGLEQNRALESIAAVVHFLDVGGVAVPEAAGLAAVVGGARMLAKDDDQLLKAMIPVLDSLYATFAETVPG